MVNGSDVEEVVNVEAASEQLQIVKEGRVSDALDQRQLSELPIPQRDVFALTKLSAGATFIAGAANSTKLTNSPVVTVNGNRYRGNNYVLDGAMNSNSNNSGEPAIVPSIEAVEEVQLLLGRQPHRCVRAHRRVEPCRARLLGADHEEVGVARHRGSLATCGEPPGRGTCGRKSPF